MTDWLTYTVSLFAKKDVWRHKMKIEVQKKLCPYFLDFSRVQSTFKQFYHYLTLYAPPPPPPYLHMCHTKPIQSVKILLQARHADLVKVCCLQSSMLLAAGFCSLISALSLTKWVWPAWPGHQGSLGRDKGWEATIRLRGQEGSWVLMTRFEMFPIFQCSVENTAQILSKKVQKEPKLGAVNLIFKHCFLKLFEVNAYFEPFMKHLWFQLSRGCTVEIN